MTQDQAKKTIASAATLAAASDLVAGVVLQIAGNDISNSIQGSPINRGLVCSLVQSRISQNLKARTAA